MLLAGPLPGILIGLALALALRAGGGLALRTAAAMLIAVNAFNLLPLAVLDGGKLLQLTIFQRDRRLEMTFLVVASVGLLAASVWFDDTVLRYVGIATLVSLPLRNKLLKAAQALREKDLALPDDARDLDGEPGRAVFQHAWDALDERRRKSSRNMASMMESLVDLVSRTVPSSRQTVLLLCAWAVGLAASGAGIWLLKHPAFRWREVRDPASQYRVWMPDDPEREAKTIPSPAGPLAVKSLSVKHGNHAFIVSDIELPIKDADFAAWHQETIDRFVKGDRKRIRLDETKDVHGSPGFELIIAPANPANPELRTLGVQRGDHRYVLVAGGPSGDPAMKQFLDSFDLE
jgi:hypothetical protein